MPHINICCIILVAGYILRDMNLTCDTEWLLPICYCLILTILKYASVRKKLPLKLNCNDLHPTRTWVTRIPVNNVIRELLSLMVRLVWLNFVFRYQWFPHLCMLIGLDTPKEETSCQLMPYTFFSACFCTHMIQWTAWCHLILLNGLYDKQK